MPLCFARATCALICSVGAVLTASACVGATVRTKASIAGSFPVADTVRIGADDAETRFVMDFSRRIDVATFTLANPYRVVVDLPQVVFKLPAGTGEHGRGLIKAFRYGLVMEGGSRIVLNTKGPVRVRKAFTLPPAQGEPARLVLELSATDRAKFMHTLMVQDGLDRNTLTMSAKAISGSTKKHSRPLIVLDPGHGGIDSGTRSRDGKVEEKNIVLAFALKLRKDLERGGKYRVAMTRSDDTFVPLEARVRFARRRHASLFISIHCDSLPPGAGYTTGATIYTESKKASDAAAAKVAKKENDSDVVAGVDLSQQPDDVANILFDLVQHETKVFSVKFARDLVGKFRGPVPLHDPAIKSASFVVLKDPDVPSVLVELGYLSSLADLKNLTSPVWRARTAMALTRAVNAFFAPRVAGNSQQAH
ncbi:MAG: N-acetylmuramoyl-L-alanine amidase [Pseudolabrys sp.]|jgi:N-acetylmuramoyl-L-alanine amidase